MATEATTDREIKRNQFGLYFRPETKIQAMLTFMSNVYSRINATLDKLFRELEGISKRGDLSVEESGAQRAAARKMCDATLKGIVDQLVEQGASFGKTISPMIKKAFPTIEDTTTKQTMRDDEIRGAFAKLPLSSIMGKYLDPNTTREIVAAIYTSPVNLGLTAEQLQAGFESHFPPDVAEYKAGADETLRTVCNWLSQAYAHAYLPADNRLTTGVKLEISVKSPLWS